MWYNILERDDFVKKYKYLLCILLFMICPNFVNAQTCSNSEKVKYQEMAKNIDIAYEFVEEDTVYFKLTVSNIMDGFYIRDLRYEKNYFPTSNEIILSDKYSPGVTYKFMVYTTDPNCSNEKLYMHYLNLPHYNYYHDHSLCKGIEEFKYCQKWINNPMGFDDFIDTITEYRKSLEITEDPIIDEETNSNFIDIVLDFYLDYYYFLLPIIIIICVIVIIRQDRKNSLF